MSVVHLLRRRSWLAVLLLALIVFALAACGGKKKKPTDNEPPKAPTPDSPAHLVDLIEYSWDQQSPADYKQVFTSDYAYQFAPSDSQNITLNRAQELAMADSLFTIGTHALPKASSISLSMPILAQIPDDRPGKTARWHQRVDCQLSLSVNTSGPSYFTGGLVTLYMTRGDSAAIPGDLGSGPDSTRWYLDRWIDKTDCEAGKRCVTVGTVKLDYLGLPH